MQYFIRYIKSRLHICILGYWVLYRTCFFILCMCILHISSKMSSIGLFCSRFISFSYSVLHFIADTLYCTTLCLSYPVLHYYVAYCMYYIVMSYIVLHCNVLSYIMICCNAMFLLHDTALRCLILLQIVLYCTKLHCYRWGRLCNPTDCTRGNCIDLRYNNSVPGSCPGP